MAPDNKFKVVRRGPQTVKSDNRPPDTLLADLEPGTVIEGPDKVQWIVMPAQPKRWEKHKRPVKQAGTATPTTTPPAAQTS